MADELSKSYAFDCLKGTGFDVEIIPEHWPEQRADLRASYSNEEYVIEVKEKSPTQQWIEHVEKLERDGRSTIARKIVPPRSIARVIKDANDQLKATPASDGAFRLLWLIAPHDDGEFVLERAKVRLFGLEKLNVIESFGSTKLCFYHNYSDFRRFPEMDGAILSTLDGSKLCINSFSPRRKTFCISHLYDQFAYANSICDPVVLEARGKAFVIGEDFAEKPTGREQWAYLRKKYGQHTSVMLRSQIDAGLTFPPGSIA